MTPDTDDDFLRTLLASQDLQDSELAFLDFVVSTLARAVRSEFSGNDLLINAGGSYGKGMMVRCAYDLDVVVTFPPHSKQFGDAPTRLAELLTMLSGRDIERTAVALRLPLSNELGVDVVIARKVASASDHMRLRYNREMGDDGPLTLKTSISAHVRAVRSVPGLLDVIRTLKVWKHCQKMRKAVTGFYLELAAAAALRDSSVDCVTAPAAAVRMVWAFMERERYRSLPDPANASNRVHPTSRKYEYLSDRLEAVTRTAIASGSISEVISSHPRPQRIPALVMPWLQRDKH